MLKKMILFLMLTLAIVGGTLNVSYAMDIQYEDVDEEGEVTITADVPQGFNERISVYIDKAPMTLFYLEGANNNGYTMTVPVALGEHKLAVMSTTDVNDMYAYSVPESINIKKDGPNTIEVTITQNENAELADEEINDHDELHQTDSAEETVLPAEYDYSDGQEYGTVHVKSNYYAAVKTVIYSLVGADRVYDIVLNRDHLFEANVKLPVGSYRESSSIKVDLDQDANSDDAIRFSWEHVNQVGAFGKSYDITPQSQIDVSDLAVYMYIGNDTGELDSNLLFNKKLMDNKESQEAAHKEAALESIFGDESTEETIASTEPVEETSDIDVLFVLLALVGVLGVAFIGLTIYRIKSKNH